MAKKGLQLKDMFSVVLRAMKNKREDVNALDTDNGNHGDNMVQNIGLIMDALENSGDVSPAAALLNASQKLLVAGRGGTSQYYANGLDKVAQLFEGRDELNAEDGMTLVEALMGAIPVAGHPDEGESVPSVLDMVATLSGQESNGASYAEGMGQIGDLMTMLGSVMGTGLDENPVDTAENQLPSGIMDMVGDLLGGQQDTFGEEESAFDMDDIIKSVLPSGLALVSSMQGGDEGSTARVDLVRALLGAKEKQADSPREGAAKVIGKTILDYVLGTK